MATALALYVVYLVREPVGSALLGIVGAVRAIPCAAAIQIGVRVDGLPARGHR